jgi:hypothetical protein
MDDINEYGFNDPSEIKISHVNVNDLFDVFVWLVAVEKK